MRKNVVSITPAFRPILSISIPNASIPMISPIKLKALESGKVS
jgi:hypothetical protein